MSAETVVRFQVGRTYETRSIADWDCIIRATIERRTDKTVWVDGKPKRVDVWDGAECFRPWGRYSMAPIMSARKEVAG